MNLQVYEQLKQRRYVLELLLSDPVHAKEKAATLTMLQTIREQIAADPPSPDVVQAAIDPSARSQQKAPTKQ